jgi:hypothetical protein
VCIVRLLALPTILVVSPLSRLLAFFCGQAFGAEKHKTNSLSCAYVGQPVLSLVSSIVLTHLKGKKNTALPFISEQPRAYTSFHIFASRQKQTTTTLKQASLHYLRCFRSVVAGALSRILFPCPCLLSYQRRQRRQRQKRR